VEAGITVGAGAGAGLKKDGLLLALKKVAALKFSLVLLPFLLLGSTPAFFLLQIT